MALSAAQQQTMFNKIERYLDAPTGAIPRKVIAAVLDEPITRGGGAKGKTSLRSTIAYLDSNLAATQNIVEQLAKGQGVVIDYKLVEAAAAAGVAAALVDSVELEATVNIKNGATK